MVGNATGNFGNQLNQGSQDVYLTKYNSAGNQQWTELLGSAGLALAYSLALNPQGGVVVAGSTTADLSTTAIADGNADSFVASYDANGNQNWTTQIQTLNQNQAAAVSVDASGNVYVGGQTTGPMGAVKTRCGSSDAYLAQLNSSGERSQLFVPVRSCCESFDALKSRCKGRSTGSRNGRSTKPNERAWSVRRL